ncbi:hypothetical protein B0H13DRAFT_2371556 [Mycena leptocephala]|nr:hypothetical protein B0H13DRAFT_2371556 [Mycena leptocephala]
MSILILSPCLFTAAAPTRRWLCLHRRSTLPHPSYTSNAQASTKSPLHSVHAQSSLLHPSGSIFCDGLAVVSSPASALFPLYLPYPFEFPIRSTVVLPLPNLLLPLSTMHPEGYHLALAMVSHPSCVAHPLLRAGRPGPDAAQPTPCVATTSGTGCRLQHQRAPTYPLRALPDVLRATLQALYRSRCCPTPTRSTTRRRTPSPHPVPLATRAACDAGAPTCRCRLRRIPVHPNSLSPIQPRRSQPTIPCATSLTLPLASTILSTFPPPRLHLSRTSIPCASRPYLFINAYLPPSPSRGDAPAGGQRATRPHEKHTGRAERCGQASLRPPRCPLCPPPRGSVHQRERPLLRPAPCVNDLSCSSDPLAEITYVPTPSVCASTSGKIALNSSL